ncbi:MAG: potassium channel protein [Chloroflexi bacterium]|nr:potassium channel protein [Chloroflexota bacterium]
MCSAMSQQIRRKLIWSSAILVAILLIGTTGYWLIAGGEHSLIDALYMTVITISTIGYGEIIDLSGNAAGRIFTMFVAISGIGLLAYVVTNLTALVVEGELSEALRRRKMERMAHRSQDHYIVCGIGSVGLYVVNELQATKRPYVAVDNSKADIDRATETWPNMVYIEGDATDADILMKAGIQKAKGLFACTGDDNQNLVVCLTARQANARLRIVARCNDVKSADKLKTAGADAVVAPPFIGGLRMASEMVRPTVVSFLDIMLRDTGKNLRVEELEIPHSFVGKSVSSLKMSSDSLLLAIRTQKDWVYNPGAHYIIQPDDRLILMTTPEARLEMGQYLNASD